MVTMATDMVEKSKIAAIIIITVTSSYVNAGSWQFSPQMIIEEVYTDNVKLTDLNAVSSYVSQAGLSIATSYKSKTIEFNLNSDSLYATYSHDHELDNDYHTLDSNFNINLGLDGLALVGNVQIENRSKDYTRNALADIVSADTTQVVTYISGLEYSLLRSSFNLNSSLLYIQKESDDNIGNQEGYNATIISKSGSAKHNIFWDLKGNYQERENNGKTARSYTGEIKFGYLSQWKINPFIRYYDEDSRGNINSTLAANSNSVGLGLRWLVTPKLSVDVSYNDPRGNKEFIEGKEQKKYTDFSVYWNPSNRTQLAANFSQRFFGDSYGLDLTHNNNKLTNKINYSEEVQSFTRDNYIAVEKGSFWCPEGDLSNLNSCYADGTFDTHIDNYRLVSITDYELLEDDVLSLNKKLSLSSELKIGRSSFAINIGSSKRENLETKIQDNINSISFIASRKVSGKSSLRLKSLYTNYKFHKNTDNERQDRYRQFSIGYKKSLNSTLNLNFDIAHVNRSSNTQQFNYEEGRVTFKITKDF